MNGFGGGKSGALVGNGDGGRVDRRVLEASLEVQFVGRGGPNHIPLVADDAITLFLRRRRHGHRWRRPQQVHPPKCAA